MSMTTATITSKGRITIPAPIRQALNIDAGDRVEFVQLKPGNYMFVAANRSVTDLKGMLGIAKRVVLIVEMNRTVASRESLTRTRRSTTSGA